MKKHENFTFFRGTIVTYFTGITLSGEGTLFGTFLMKNISTKISARILNHVFCSISVKMSCFFEANLIVMYGYDVVVKTKPMKIIGFFDEIMSKTWFKMRVGKLMKIFFIRNVPNNIPLPLKMFPVMPLAPLPRKSMIFSCVFMFSDYCRVSLVNACTVAAPYRNAHC